MIKKIIKGYFLTYTELPKTCYMPLFLNMVNAISIGFSFFISIYFVTGLHFNINEAGVLMSFYGLGTVVGGYLSGKLCDRIPSQSVSTFSLILQASSFFLLSKFKMYYLVAVNLFILGFSTFGFKTANNLLLLLACGESESMRLKSLNISHVALNLGFGISGIFMGIISDSGFNTIFSIAASIIMISAVLQVYDNMSNKKLYAFSKHKTSQFHEGKFKRDNKFNYKKFNVLSLTVLSIFFIGLIVVQLSSTYPVYIKNVLPDYGIKAVSILYLLDTVLIVAFQSSLPKYYLKYNTVFVMGLGALLTGIGTFLLNFSNTLLLAIISCIFWTTGEMLFMPTSASLCYELGDANKKGSSMGLWLSTYALSKVVGPLVGSSLYYYFSSSILWWSATLMALFIFFSCSVATCFLGFRAEFISEKC